jgi:hypothetical protein
MRCMHAGTHSYPRPTLPYPILPSHFQPQNSASVLRLELSRSFLPSFFPPTHIWFSPHALREKMRGRRGYAKTQDARQEADTYPPTHRACHLTRSVLDVRCGKEINRVVWVAIFFFYLGMIDGCWHVCFFCWVGWWMDGWMGAM